MIFDSLKFKLHAVNILLQSINELPITDEEDIAALQEAQIAEAVIEEVKFQVLSEGWDINSDKDWEFTPDSSGSINIPSTVLDLTDKAGRYVVRDWRLYDKQDKTYKFEDTVLCDVAWNTDFNALTHPIRYYITVKASRIFQRRTIGDVAEYQYSIEDEQDAYEAALHSEDFTGKYNMGKGSYGLNFGRNN